MKRQRDDKHPRIDVGYVFTDAANAKGFVDAVLVFDASGEIALFLSVIAGDKWTSLSLFSL